MIRHAISTEAADKARIIYLKERPRRKLLTNTASPEAVHGPKQYTPVYADHIHQKLME